MRLAAVGGRDPNGGVVVVEVLKYGIICAMRSLRNFKTNRCCHLIGRLARRAFFLNDEEETRFVGYMSLENPASIHSPLLRYRLLAKGRRMAR